MWGQTECNLMASIRILYKDHDGNTNSLTYLISHASHVKSGFFCVLVSKRGNMESVCFWYQLEMVFVSKWQISLMLTDNFFTANIVYYTQTNCPSSFRFGRSCVRMLKVKTKKEIRLKFQLQMPNCLKEYVSKALLALIRTTNNCDANEEVDWSWI